LVFKELPGDHMRLEEDDLRDAFKTYLSPTGSKGLVNDQTVLASQEL